MWVAWRPEVFRVEDLEEQEWKYWQTLERTWVTCYASASGVSTGWAAPTKE